MELNEIDSIDGEFNRIIRNKYGQINTIIENKKYIMIKKNNSNVLDSIINMKSILYNSISTITRTNWVELWCNKIDNIEYQLSHIGNKYRIIKESIGYYIGMAETAISYINNTFREYNMDINNYLVIAHERIIKDDFNNPQNIVIDYKSRDVSEYLKYLFINDIFDYDKIELLFKKLKLNKFLYQLVYGRMLFPTFYFDIYDSIINNKSSEKEIKKIIAKANDYEDYIQNIYSIINSFVSIQEINWINQY